MLVGGRLQAQFARGSQNISRKVHLNITLFFALLVGCKIVNIAMDIKHSFLTVSVIFSEKKMGVRWLYRTN